MSTSVGAAAAHRHGAGVRLLGARDRLDVRLGQRLLEPPQRVAQLPLAEDLAQAGAVGAARDLRLEVELDGDVVDDRGELLGEPRGVGELGQVLLALGARDLVDAREHGLEVAEALQQVRGGLVADARDAGDVVARVALEADEVGDQLRRDAVAVDHALAVVDLRVGDAARGGHDPHALADQLVGVAVAGHDHHGDLALLRLLDERGDHVVGLEALDGDVAVPERLDQRAQVRPLQLQEIGPARALRLVVGGELLAARQAGVPHHDGRHLAVIGEDLHEHRREAEDRVRRAPVRGRDRLGEREERAIGERVPVDQEQLARGVSVAGCHPPDTLCRTRGGGATSPRTPSIGCSFRDGFRDHRARAQDASARGGRPTGTGRSGPRRAAGRPRADARGERPGTPGRGSHGRTAHGRRPHPRPPPRRSRRTPAEATPPEATAPAESTSPPAPAADAAPPEAAAPPNARRRPPPPTRRRRPPHPPNRPRRRLPPPTRRRRPRRSHAARATAPPEAAAPAEARSARGRRARRSQPRRGRTAADRRSAPPPHRARRRRPPLRRRGRRLRRRRRRRVGRRRPALRRSGRQARRPPSSAPQAAPAVRGRAAPAGVLLAADRGSQGRHRSGAARPRPSPPPEAAAPAPEAAAAPAEGAPPQAETPPPSGPPPAPAPEPEPVNEATALRSRAGPARRRGRACRWRRGRP